MSAHCRLRARREVGGAQLERCNCRRRKFGLYRDCVEIDNAVVPDKLVLFDLQNRVRNFRSVFGENFECRKTLLRARLAELLGEAERERNAQLQRFAARVGERIVDVDFVSAEFALGGAAELYAVPRAREQVVGDSVGNLAYFDVARFHHIVDFVDGTAANGIVRLIFQQRLPRHIEQRFFRFVGVPEEHARCEHRLNPPLEQVLGVVVEAFYVVARRNGILHKLHRAVPPVVRRFGKLAPFDAQVRRVEFGQVHVVGLDEFALGAKLPYPRDFLVAVVGYPRVVVGVGRQQGAGGNRRIFF